MMREQSIKLGNAIRAERGVDNAINYVKQYLGARQ
jgi:hypothetical protein